MRLLKFLVNSNIYISLGAVLLTIETQILLGIEPQLKPYILLVFSGTLAEYNFHRLFTILTIKNALESEKFRWVKNNLRIFYLIIFLSIIGLSWALLNTDSRLLFVLLPFALITLLYTFPLFTFRLRQIPYLKIFLIAVVWSGITTILPALDSNLFIYSSNFILLFISRIIFIFAITIPFDIRDLETDKLVGLKTIPTLVTESSAILISQLSLILFIILSLVLFKKHLSFQLPLVISIVTTLFILSNKKLRSSKYYHYGFLDGCILLQGVLVIGFYSFPKYFPIF